MSTNDKNATKKLGDVVRAGQLYQSIIIYTQDGKKRAIYTGPVLIWEDDDNIIGIKITKPKLFPGDLGRGAVGLGDREAE